MRIIAFLNGDIFYAFFVDIFSSVKGKGIDKFILLEKISIYPKSIHAWNEFLGMHTRTMLIDLFQDFCGVES